MEIIKIDDFMGYNSYTNKLEKCVVHNILSIIEKGIMDVIPRIDIPIHVGMRIDLE